MHIPKTRYAAALGIPLLALLSFTLVTAWTGPTQAPPNGNVAAPINVGATDQVKNGGLGVNSLAVFGNSLFGGSTGSNAYLNFGVTGGTNGYGIRDNAGVLEFKDSGGSWASIQSTVYTLVGGAGSWAASGSDIYSTNSGNVGIGNTNPGAKLDVAGEVKFGNTSSACDATKEGQQRYNAVTKQMEFCNGTAWMASDGTIGYQIVTASCSSATCIATCPGTKYVLGGGCRSGSSNVYVAFSYPDANNQWRCYFNQSGSVNSYAICANVR